MNAKIIQHQKELTVLLNSIEAYSKDDLEFFKNADNLYEWIYSDIDKETIYKEAAIPQYIRQRIVEIREFRIVREADVEALEKKVRIPFMATRKFVWMAAASIALLFIVAAYMFRRDSLENNRTIASSPGEIFKDIDPGSNKAVLTLADGSTVILDDKSEGSVATQGNVKIINLNQQLSYVSGPLHSYTQPATEILYNTISTPRGGQYQLILSDGSKVWLNAASSLRFPTTFAGTERNVELIGEGYFEIAKDAKRSFHVSVGEMDVQVLGTHFNVMAYNDENFMAATLLEGSVKIKKGIENVLLSPGQQSQVSPLTKGSKIIVKQVDPQQITAWKNDYFQFQGADIKTIMRQVERWYNVKVIYEGQLPFKQITGRASRKTKLSELLQVLEFNDIHFDVKENTITVKP